MYRLVHIIAIVFAVGFALGPEFLIHKLVHTGDARSIRTILKIAIPFGKLTPPLFITGAITGLIAAHMGSYNYLAPWLLASYAIFVLMIVLGAAFHDPWLKRIQIAADASPDEGRSAALQEALDTPKGGQLIVFLSPFAIIIMIILMVTKPGN